MEENLEKEAGPEEFTARRRRLVSALRSGQWQQVTGKLARAPQGADPRSGFCCLGVACEVAIADGLALHKKMIIGHINYLSTRTGVGSNTLLPPVAQQWYGFNSPDPMLEVPQEVWQEYPRLADWAERHDDSKATRAATALNDDYRLTLPHIGDCFEYTFLREDWEASRGQAAAG